MKVLIDASCGRTSDGIASSLFWISGVEVISWSSDIKPIMDMFDETQPDIVILSNEHLHKSELAIASSRYPNTRIVSLNKTAGYDYSIYSKGGAEKSIGGLTPGNQIEAHLTITKFAGTENGSGGKHLHFGGGAMIGNIGSPPRVETLKTDLLCLTDHIQNFTLANEILGFLCKNYNIKIFGKNWVPFPNYLGQIDTRTQAEALASTAIYIDLDGLSWHDAAWLGKPCVLIGKKSANSFETPLSSIYGGLSPQMGQLNELPLASVLSWIEWEGLEGSSQKLKETVDNSLNHSRGTSNKGTPNSEEIKSLMKDKTYFELTHSILSFFGLSEQAEVLMEKKREMLC